MGLPCAVFALLLGVAGCQSFANVTLPLGDVQGLVEENYVSWRGIPYAESVVGEYRWTLPRPKTPWSGTLSALAFKSACAQDCGNPPHLCPTTFEENCLHLNVWAPRNALWGFNATKGLLPVMVWIHGGDFKYSWAGPEYGGKFLSNYTDHVLVSMDYRLGALGFLYYKGAGITPNLGIWDQRLALEWVQDNIRYFGGDPNRVTLFGQSAGGGSVAIHYVSRHSAGLFNGIIMQSFPAGVSFKTVKESEPFGKSLAEELNCHGLFRKPEKVLSCMKAKTWQEVAEAQKKVAKDRVLKALTHPLAFAIIFGPLIETPDLPNQPITMIEQGNFNKVPMITGALKDDGWWFIQLLLKKSEKKLVCEAAVRLLFGRHASTVLKQYPCSRYKDSREALNHIITDYVFACAAHNMALSGARHGVTTYMYNYTHQLNFNPYLPLLPGCATHVCHSSELSVLFHSAYAIGGKLTSTEITLGEEMEHLWSTFLPRAQHGLPITGFKTSRPLWYPLNASEPENTPTLQMGPGAQLYQTHGHASAVCKMWDSIGYINM